ncbi:MAG: ABC transporter ATP-binding protein [Chloroflexota bacterium]
MGSTVNLSALKKHYQMGGVTVRALDGVDLDIPANAFTVVMGPSGSGKSTLLYLVGGLDRPTSGGVKVAGQDLEAMDENQLAGFRRQAVGFIFQSFNLIPSMSALDNVIFPMQFARVSRRERSERAHALLERVGLGDRSRHKPTEMSGGQQQRVAIARALVNDPQLILADEPTGNLDTASGNNIAHVLAELHKSGRTVIVVTHDPRMLRYATHVVYLLDGKVVSEADYQRAILLSEVPAADD